MTKKKVRLNNQEWRVLYCLTKRGGRAPFDHMISESGLCAGHIMNHANELIKKGLIIQGKTFNEYVITPEGKRRVKETMVVP